VLDAKGEPLRPGKTVQFSVTESGIARKVLGAGPVGEERPWRLVIWFDRMLSGSRTLRGAAGALAAQAPLLVSLGTVEVILAEPEPRVILPATRDAHAVDEALSRLLLTGDGRDDLRTLRQRFVDAVGAPASGTSGTATGTAGTDVRSRAEEAVAEEMRLVARQQDTLTGWLTEDRAAADRPSALFLVSDGFDRDPRELYLAQVSDPAIRAALEKSIPAAALDAPANEAARTAAELGLTVLPMPVGDERLPELRRFQLGGSPGAPAAVTVRPGAKPEAPPAPPSLLLHPKEPLAVMADATGGEMVTGPSGVPGALARLRSRLWLRYEVPASTAATAASMAGRAGSPGSLGPLAVAAADPGLKVKARRWAEVGTPAGVSAWRARRLLAEDEEEESGDLRLTAALKNGVLELRLDPEERPAADGPPLRLTLAVSRNGEIAGPAVTQRALTAQDVAEDGTCHIPFPLPADTDRLAVLVDDPAHGALGRWGGRAIDVKNDGGAEEGDEETEKPGPAGRDARNGRIVGPPAVRPTAHGNGVHIVRPTANRGTGPVDVEVEVKLPAQRRLERLELYWNDELQATLYAPPFRHRVVVPRGRPVGTLRAEGHLDDGSVAEDAILLNGSTLGERVDVRLVELLVVVTDKEGRPVRGLGRNDFRLLQDGKDQSIASFDDAGDFPLTVGLAMDTSASMFIKLPGVVEAARSLLTGGLTAKDSAFLIGYATDPRLLVTPTRDLRSVSSGLDTLSAEGGSNLFRAIEYSLAEIRKVGGRKALVVYSDGIGQGEHGYRDCLRAARESGVPIYLIVTNATTAHALEEHTPISSYAEKLERLAAVTGAKAYFVTPSQDLKAVYAEILRELRSQYLVAYYPKANELDVWRRVEVEVKGKDKGYKARTLSGYYTRP
jgi:Ca-activated chloride channel family protein